MATSPATRLRPPLVLALDLSTPVSDDRSASPLARVVRPVGAALRDLVELIRLAADDRRVRGLVARVDHPADSWAHAQELHAAVAAVRRAGKPAIAHAQSFGEAGDGTLAFLVAAAFDEVHLQPTGDLGVTGVAAEVPFLAAALDKLDVEAQIDRRHEYKSAAELFTQRGFTDAHREAVDRIVASRHEQLIAAVAEGRGLERDGVAALIDRAPMSAGDALAAGLVDRLAYRDETVQHVKDLAGGAGVKLISPRRYRKVRRWRRPDLRRRTSVALVHGQGAITVGRSRRTLTGQTMGADTVVAGFSQALRDKRTKAILFRVDSPGGSAVASDAIARAVARAREAGMPVIVSMGAVAGSGGYWVAMGADRILASPGTITGSIGVVSGKLVVRGLRQRLGVTIDEVHRGTNALMFSSNERFSDEQWTQLQQQLDRIYDTFLTKVAAGRGLDREHVHDVARGRVWTGADALEHDLVDQLGGYHEALAAIRRALGLPEGAHLRLRVLPQQRPAERLGLRQPDPEDVRLLRTAAGVLRSAAGAAQGSARMPDWSTRLG